MKRLAILGASGHGKVVADTAEICGWGEVSFFDDAWPDKNMNGQWRIVGNTETLLQSLDQFEGVVVAIGNNGIRKQKMDMLIQENAVLVSIIHPTAVISRYVSIGEGSVVFANVVVNVGAKVGGGVILNTACSVDHDCKLGDAVHISPGAHIAGDVWIGEASWVGIGASVRQGIHIGELVVVGAGACVISDIIDEATVVGVPAKARHEC